jgi:SAM-dependent methyltransferase
MASGASTAGRRGSIALTGRRYAADPERRKATLWGLTEGDADLGEERFLGLVSAVTSGPGCDVDEAIPNVEQAEHWDGEGSRHWVEYQDQHDAFVAPLDAHLFAAAGISDGDRVLDVGCGCGATTRTAARAAADGGATGIDLSAAMLERARSVANQDGLSNVRFVHGDAQVYPFEQAGFDVAISRFGVMFFVDPTAAFTNLARATRPQGQLVFVCWQELQKNECLWVPVAAALTHVRPPDPGSPDAPGPFSLADPDRVRSILSAAGWRDVDLQEVKEQLPLGGDTDAAVTFVRGFRFVQRLLADADDATVARAVEAVRDAFVAHETSDGVVLGSTAWVVSARR